MEQILWTSQECSATLLLWSTALGPSTQGYTKANQGWASCPQLTATCSLWSPVIIFSYSHLAQRDQFSIAQLSDHQWLWHDHENGNPHILVKWSAHKPSKLYCAASGKDRGFFTTTELMGSGLLSESNCRLCHQFLIRQLQPRWHMKTNSCLAYPLPCILHSWSKLKKKSESHKKCSSECISKSYHNYCIRVTALCVWYIGSLYSLAHSD